MMIASESLEDFNKRLENIEEIVSSSDLLLNQDLEATEKWGFRWIVRIIARPFCSLFCYDVFSDVRINKVVENFKEYLQANQSHYATADSLRERVTAISERIITPLKERTHYQYDESLDSILESIQESSAENDRTPTTSEAPPQRAPATEAPRRTAEPEVCARASATAAPRGESVAEAQAARVRDMAPEAEARTREGLARITDTLREGQARIRREAEARGSEAQQRARQREAELDAQFREMMGQSAASEPRARDTVPEAQAAQDRLRDSRQEAQARIREAQQAAQDRLRDARQEAQARIREAQQAAEAQRRAQQQEGSVSDAQIREMMDQLGASGSWANININGRQFSTSSTPENLEQSNFNVPLFGMSDFFGTSGFGVPSFGTSGFEVPQDGFGSDAWFNHAFESARREFSESRRASEGGAGRARNSSSASGRSSFRSAPSSSQSAPPSSSSGGGAARGAPAAEEEAPRARPEVNGFLSEREAAMLIQRYLEDVFKDELRDLCDSRRFSSREITSEEILSVAFRKWTLKHHPDSSRVPVDQKGEATTRFQEVSAKVAELREFRGWR